MAGRRFQVRFKISEVIMQPVFAGDTVIQGEHIFFVNSKGKLAGLFLVDILESWSETDR